MAEQIISPGVFTRENDLSFLPQGVGAIGAAIIGPTVKGPAFVPTVVRSFSEYERKFGPLSSETFVPQTVREYLRNAGSVTVCRVLAGGGWSLTNGTNEFFALAVSSSEGDGKHILVGAVFPSKNTAVNGTDLGSTTIHRKYSGGMSASFGSPFCLNMPNSTNFSASLNPANNDYVFKYLGDTPDNSKSGASAYGGTPGYTYVNFKNLQTDIISATSKELVTTTLSDYNLTSSLLSNVTVSSSIVFTDPDGSQHHLYFSGSKSQAGATATVISGSLVVLDVEGGKTVTSTGISGSQLANAFTSSANFSGAGSAELLNQWKFSAAGAVLTMEPYEAGDDNADINRFNSHLSASEFYLTNSTQGADVTGYSGSNADREFMFVTQSFNMEWEGLSSTTEKYRYASTPWIQSQISLGQRNLFKIHTLAHGTVCNKDYKISIANLQEPTDIDGMEQYSQFSVILRKYSDKDKVVSVVEQFNNCSLDPDSPTYISRVIGDRYPEYNDTLDKVELLGNFGNVSEYIRIEVDEAIASRATSPKLSPKGFAAVYNPINTASLHDGGNYVFPSASYEGTQTIGGVFNSKAYLGWKFNDKKTDNDNFIRPIPKAADTNVSGKFSIENYSGHASSSLWVGSLSASIDVTGVQGPTSNQLKFSVPFQEGDDGIAPWQVRFVGNEAGTLPVSYTGGTNLYGFDVSSTTKAGYTGYKKALDILSNQDEYDINMLAMPGVIKQVHSNLTTAGIDMCEERADCFFVMDLTRIDASVNTAVDNVSGLDSNYTAVYYPWVKVLDTVANKPILVPPSVIVPGAIAQSDRISQGAEWFAPAGLNRGVLGSVIDVKTRLNQAERDTLYNEKINPIAFFPGVGSPCIWGQKTLQSRSTALDRINVRRLLITVKKFIASSSKYLIFEQNTIATRTRFLNIVNPYLESIQQRQGLYAFRVQMDEANNTPDVIDRNQLVGAIYLQPTKTAEFIILDFNVLPTGATFDGGGGGGGY